jgi:hypothetical protein
MVTFSPADLINHIKPDTLRVHAPSRVVFLCGGTQDSASPKPLSRRDAFFRTIPATSSKYRTILAEDANPLTTEAGYKDLFRFEQDIAHLVGLVLLFVESPGSIAELGAFAALQPVAARLLAVLDDFHYEQVSFIKNGPVLHLETEYGEESILTLDRKELGIDDEGSIIQMDETRFNESVLPEVEKRLENLVSWSSFDSKNRGHIIILMTGLCQEFGALKITEIRTYLEKLGVRDLQVNNYIYCAQLLGWLKKIHKGNNIFYVASPLETAIDFIFDGEAGSTFDKMRWRASVREHWKATDRPRFGAISEIAAASAGDL